MKNILNSNLLRRNKSILYFFGILLSLAVVFPGNMFGNSLKQDKTITGTVTDGASNEPLPGVTVVVKGTTTGTITDINGKFSIQAMPEDILVFSFVGYLKEEIMVAEQTMIALVLAPDIIDLDELVVIGYGVQKKSDLTGAIASVSTEDLQKIPNTGVGSMLQGMAAGVQVTNNTGAPGSNVTIRVHGIPTITSIDGVAQGQPIWIIDGVPASPNSVSSSDIKSIEILKDASSAAIYGSNGGAGVILVTTKKGEEGKPKVNLNYYYASQVAPNRIDMATGPEFGRMFTEMEALRGETDFTFPGYADASSFDAIATHDYQDMVFREGMLHNIDFSVSSGNDRTNTYLGLGYVNQEGILEGTSHQRFNFRVNSEYQVNKWFMVGERISFNYTNTPGFEEWQYQNEYESPLMNAIVVHPYLEPYDNTGNYVPNGLGQAGSPLPSIELLHKEFNRREGNGLVFARITPVKGLALETRLSGSLSFNDNYDFLPTFSYGVAPGQFRNISEIYRRYETSNGYNWQNILTYNTTIIDAINIGAMVGFEIGEGKYRYMSGRRLDLATEEPEMWYFDASTDETSPSQINESRGGGNESAGWAVFTRLNLDYKSTYLLQLNFRRDASSKFGPDNRIGNFPGLSVGLKFSEYDFVKNLGILSFGKFRYGYGVAGVNTIDDYAFYATAAYLTHFGYGFDNAALSTGGSKNVLVDPMIHWEEIVTHNYGVDLAFFSNQLTLSVDRFHRTNLGLLIRETTPGYAGWTVRDIYQEADGMDPRPYVNRGNMVNTGWDFVLGYTTNIGNIQLNANLSYSYVETIAEDLGTDSILSEGGARGLAGDICRTETGYGVSDFYGFETDGLFTIEDSDSTLADGTPFITNQPSYISPSGDVVWAQRYAAPGDIRFVDTDGDGEITQDDRVRLGNPFPKHELGFTLNLTWKMIDFSMFWQGAFGYQIFNANKYYLYNNDGNFNWSQDFVNDHYRWQDVTAVDGDGNTVATFSANTSSENPRLDPFNRNNNYGRISDFYIENGSYLRLKNLQIGVSLPKQVTKIMHLEQFRIYIGAKNLLTITKYSGMDPEVPTYSVLSAGIDKASYPQARMYLAGVNIKF